MGDGFAASPESSSEAAKFVPVITQFVGSKGGADVAQLLAAALK